MQKRTKLIVGATAAAVVIGVSTGFTIAADDDEPLTGSTSDRATEAALDHIGDGTVIETEVGDGGAAYGVEIRRDDGSVVEVELDESFDVIGTEEDDDEKGEGEDDD
jgi:uncharacterized membrane protein YkoI